MKNDGWYLLTTLVMMPPMNFQLMKLLSFLMLMTAGLYPGGMEPLISRVGQGQNTFLGECTPTGAENKPPAWILDLRRSKRHLRGALH